MIRYAAGRPVSYFVAYRLQLLMLRKEASVGSPVVLGIESSCDETGAGLVRDGRLLGHALASSMDEHARFGGVVPEIAARAHVHSFGPVVRQALDSAGLRMSDIGAVAVTTGPGLSGALQVGLAGAKGLAYALDVPLYGVHHLAGHVAADTLEHGPLPDPCVVLIVSGGHTSLLLVRDLARDRIVHLGDTVDDAAGECFDKVARVFGLPYPGGPAIDRVAREGDRRAVAFPRPMTGARDAPYAFSFSGLKTAAARWAEQRRTEGGELPVADGAASLQEAVADVLTRKAVAACRTTGCPRWSWWAGWPPIRGYGSCRAAVPGGRDHAAGASAAAVHGQRGDDRGRR